MNNWVRATWVGSISVFACLVAWRMALVQELLAAWIIFMLVFLPILTLAFGFALFEEGTEQGLAWAGSSVATLVGEARRRMAHVSLPLRDRHAD